jgi:hypothetical protein
MPTLSPLLAQNTVTLTLDSLVHVLSQMRVIGTASTAAKIRLAGDLHRTLIPQSAWNPPTLYPNTGNKQCASLAAATMDQDRTAAAISAACPARAATAVAPAVETAAAIWTAVSAEL